MIKLILFALIVPSLSIGQVKKAAVKKSAKGENLIKDPANVKTPDGFLIKGNVSGYENGTIVSLINAQNGTQEATGTITDGKFSISGKAEIPDFKVLAFNRQPPYITIFLDNSLVKVTGKKATIEDAIVSGSASNDDYLNFARIVKPYEKVFSGEQTADSLTASTVAAKLSKFVKEHPRSYITPLAIYRNFQFTQDFALMENMFSTLSDGTKTSPTGQFILKQINENKKNPLGKPLADFSQPDTAGHILSLSSLKGKYVLVDFWASWCGPCRQENPNVVNMYSKYKDHNFTVLGVSLDKAKQPWIDAINMDALTWNHVSDLQGWNNSVAQKFEIYSIPQNFLLDPDGNVIAKNLRGPALESKLAAILK